jgi:hypothetical protein
MILLSLLLAASVADAQRRFGPGVCGPADPGYIRTASETGGQPFFLSPAEVASSARIMGAATQSELMLWASGDGERTYSVPIDASVERAAFSASFDGTGGTLDVLTPQGLEVHQTAGIDDTPLNCGRVIAIDAPASGAWQLRVRPSGRFWLVAHARTDLALIATEFVERGGRPGHEGFFRIQGQPIAGAPATLRVRLSSGPKNPAFQLIAVSGRVLQPIELQAVDAEEFIGSVTLPSEPFRLRATGTDESGAAFQRVSATLFHAEQIQVIPPAVETLAVGVATPVTFTIRNLGAAVRLTLTATDGHGQVLTVQPSTLQLGSASEGAATVIVAIPETEAERDVSILLTASGVAPSTAMNYARKQFAVSRR